MTSPAVSPAALSPTHTDSNAASPRLEQTQSLDPDGASFLEIFLDPFESLEELLENEQDTLDDEWEDLEFYDLLPEAPDVRELIKQRLREAVTPKSILLRDKVAYCLGSLDLLVSAFWLGHSPRSFYKLYTIKCAVLFSLRWVIYKAKRQHYYMLDYCYLVQIMLLVQLWYFPTNITLIKICFAFANGPLIASILAFRNSLVYHSLDKITSLFLHWFPACICWSTRWFPPPELTEMMEKDPALKARWEGASFRDLCLLPMLPYIAWAVFYYLKIFVFSAKKIQQRNYETLYVYVMSKKGLFSTVVSKSPRSLQPAVYMGVHLVGTVTTMLLSMFLWRDKTLSLGFIVAAFSWSAWNGASFYFDYFAHRYVSNLGLAKKHRDGSATPSVSKND